MDTELVFRSAREQLALLERKELSARELLDAHVAQITRHNPTVNAVVTVDLDTAERVATAIDDERCAGRPLGPLAGLPISIKDTHATAGLRTTCGSPLLADNVPDADDEIVRRMQVGGVVRLGKTNVPEFAAGSHTFNPVFGVTRNPYAPTRSAGGSSGGAAAALAAGFQPIADGSDMGGSLRNPASFCNVVGLRPTPGLVPDPTGLLGYLPMGTAGPMARTVGDVGLLLSVIAGRHRADPLSYDSDAAAYAAPTPASLAGMRVAWAPTLGDRVPVEADVLDTLAPNVAVFEDLGAHVEPACPDLDGAFEAFRTLRAVEFEAAFAQMYAATPDGFKPDLVWNISEGARLSGPQVGRALAELTRLQRAADRFFDDYDVLLAPVSQVTPFDAELTWPSMVAGVEQHDYLGWMESCCLITALGVPAMSVPGGFTTDGLPVGLQIITRARTEATLLAVAAAFEEATAFGLRTPDLEGINR
ncbi:amidase [Gordonia asplenii]|nr:amidase [Gordonia asplenii]